MSILKIAHGNAGADDVVAGLCLAVVQHGTELKLSELADSVWSFQTALPVGLRLDGPACLCRKQLQAQELAYD